MIYTPWLNFVKICAGQQLLCPFPWPHVEKVLFKEGMCEQFFWWNVAQLFLKCSVSIENTFWKVCYKFQPDSSTRSQLTACQNSSLWTKISEPRKMSETGLLTGCKLRTGGRIGLKFCKDLSKHVLNRYWAFAQKYYFLFKHSFREQHFFDMRTRDWA